MKANGRHEIVPETSRTKAKHGHEFFEARRVAGEIGVTRIRAKDMGPEWTAAARWIFGERKLVQPNLVRTGSDAGNFLVACRHQRAAHSRPADKGLGQL